MNSRKDTSDYAKPSSFACQTEKLRALSFRTQIRMISLSCILTNDQMRSDAFSDRFAPSRFEIGDNTIKRTCDEGFNHPPARLLALGPCLRSIGVPEDMTVPTEKLNIDALHLVKSRDEFEMFWIVPHSLPSSVHWFGDYKHCVVRRHLDDFA